MNRYITIALVVVGVVLLAFGISAHDSVVSNAKEAITGVPTDKSLWLIILGISGIIVGGLGSLLRRGLN